MREDMAEKRKTSVLLLLSDSLRRLGLEYVLSTLSEPIEVSSFHSFDEVLSAPDDAYDIAIVEANILAFHSDYFVSKRTKVVPVMDGVEPTSGEEWDKEVSYIYSYWKLSELQEVLRATLLENRKELIGKKEKELSQREEEVLKEVAKGMTNKEIADHLNISMNTVMTHRKNITAKLNIKTVPGLTFYALINGLITGDEMEDGAGRE